ncbi:MAG: hypothetical protein MUQ00_14895 [Candidatus Aminicenantes bacterium]|nr:hypothetical protein [Candidatus Aminicenantes bacterium]
MAVFLDSGRIDEAERFLSMGIIRGVTTNPTILSRCGITGGEAALEALAQATYVSLFGGRIDDMGYEAAGEIRRARTVLEGQGLTSRIIAGSIREPLNVVLWLEAGAHDVTVPPDLLRRMIVHPYSRDTIRMFLADAAKTDKQP